MTYLCHHGVPAVAVPIPGATPAQSRRLFRCSFPASTRCEFFQVDDVPPSSNLHAPSNILNPSVSTGRVGTASSSHAQRSVAPVNASGAPPGTNSINHGPGAQEAPNCRCGVPAVSRVVRKPGPNQNRHFFACAKPRDRQCKFFEWANDPTSLAPDPVSEKTNQVGRPTTFRATAPAGTTDASERGIQDFFRPQNHHLQNGPVAKRPRVQPELQPQGQGHGHGQQGWNQQIQQQPTSLSISMSGVEHVVVVLRPLLPAEVKEAARKFSGAVKVKSNTMENERLKIPVEKVSAFAAYMQAQVSIPLSLDFEAPRTTLERLASFHELERSREQAGDVVTRALDEILPSTLCNSLMEFQWDGIHFALKRGGRCLIGDDMGLGKTIQAIAIARVYMEDWPLLIVCPSSLRLNWKEEILRWLETDLDEDDIRVVMTGKDVDRTVRKVNIVSYDLIRKMPERFLKRCQFLIADESHYLKSMSAQRTKAMTPLVKNARRALLLSGTPALSRPVELFAQINAICPILFPSYNEFVVRYCNARQTFWGFDVSGSSHLDELHTILRGTLLIRRKKEEVLTQLPEKVRQVMWVETKAGVMKTITKKFEEFEDAKAAAADASTPEEANALGLRVKGLQNELYALSAEAKLNSIMEFCKDTAESGCKFIVFCHHAKVINTLHDFVENKLKLGLIRIDGNTPQGDRQMLCKQFQADDDKKRVALLSITAAGVGLTLTKASVVLFAELYWNPGSLLQAEDRAHRIGQRNSILVNYLLAKKTLDESMWRSVLRKLTVVGQSLTGRAARMDVEEGSRNISSKSGSEGTSGASAGTKKADKDIRSFFGRMDSQGKKPSTKRSRATAMGISSAGDGVEDAANEMIEVVENEDIVVPIDSVATNGANQEGNVQRKTWKGANDQFAEMFPLDSRIESNENTATSIATEQKLVDSDYALAKKLQAQWDKEYRRR